MSLDKIDFVFIHAGEDQYLYHENHYESFAKALLKKVKYQNDFLITSDWSEIRKNSLIIVFDYEEFHDDLTELTKYQQNAHEFYRRIFLINWRQISYYDDPRDYNNRSFVGNLFSRAYEVIMKNWKVSIDYPDFYGDSSALDNLRITQTSLSKQWRLSIAYKVGMYEIVFCDINILQVLGIYLDEYMEKYDHLKRLNKFAASHQKPVIKRNYDLPEEFVITRSELGSISLPTQVNGGDAVDVKLMIYPPFLQGDSTTLYPIKLTFFKVPNEDSNDYGFWVEETQQVMHDGVNYILEGDMILYFDPSKVQWEE